jgi:hypothetical protein
MSRQGWVETLVTAQVDGTVNTAGTAASAIPPAALWTVQPNILQVGSAFRIRASGRISSVITTPGTARYDVRFGGVVVFDSQAILLDTVAAHTTVGWDLEINLVCRSIGNGTNATFFGSGKWICEDILGVPAAAPKGVLTAVLPWNTTPAVGPGFNSAQANAVDLFFTQTVGTGSHTVHTYSLEALN